LNAFVDAACMNWSGNLFQTFATRIGKLFFLKLVLNRCWTILLLNWESEEIYYSNHRAEISGGSRSDIQLPDIDIIGESGEVEPRGASSGNHH
jgi:hypothetical protein